MSRLSIICLPALAALAACNAAPDNGTTPAETEAVPADDGAMAAPADTSGMDRSNPDTTGSMDTSPGNSGAVGPSADNSKGTMTDGTSPPADTSTKSGTTGPDSSGNTPPPPSK